MGLGSVYRLLFCTGSELWLQICIAYLQNVILSLYGWNKIMLFSLEKKSKHHSTIWAIPFDEISLEEVGLWACYLLTYEHIDRAMFSDSTHWVTLLRP